MTHTSNAHLQTLEEKLSVGTWSWSFTRRELHWSAGLFRLLGLDATTVIPSFSVFESLTHPDDRLLIVPSDDFAASQNDRIIRIIRPDGVMRTIRGVSQTRANADGKPQAIDGVIVDISDLAHLKAALQHAQEVTHTVASLLDVTVWEASESGELVSVPRDDTFGPSHRARLVDWKSLVNPADIADVERSSRKAWLANQEVTVSPRITLPDGSERIFYARGRLSSQTSGRPRVLIGVSSEDPKAVRHDAGVGALSGYPSSEAIRAGRAYLNWSADKLAASAGISVPTLRRLEKGSIDPVRHRRSLFRIVKCFAEAGISFQQQGGNMTMVARSIRHSSV